MPTPSRLAVLVASCSLLLIDSLLLAAPGDASAPELRAAASAASATVAKALIPVRTTAYTSTEDDHIVYGKQSAVGTTLRYGKTRSAAADWAIYPVGTQFRIAGDDHLYEVDDYGSALVGTRTIDLYKPSRAAMNEWGVRQVDITIQRWGSFERSLAILRPRMAKYPHIRHMVANLEAREERIRAIAAAPAATAPMDAKTIALAPLQALASAGAPGFGVGMVWMR
jgi:3D (Asp-Asp-Asp) domain-containing protein